MVYSSFVVFFYFYFKGWNRMYWGGGGLEAESQKKQYAEKTSEKS